MLGIALLPMQAVAGTLQGDCQQKWIYEPKMTQESTWAGMETLGTSVLELDCVVKPAQTPAGTADAIAVDVVALEKEGALVQGPIDEPFEGQASERYDIAIPIDAGSDGKGTQWQEFHLIHSPTALLLASETTDAKISGNGGNFRAINYRIDGKLQADGTFLLTMTSKLMVHKPGFAPTSIFLSHIKGDALDMLKELSGRYLNPIIDKL